MFDFIYIYMLYIDFISEAVAAEFVGGYKVALCCDSNLTPDVINGDGTSDADGVDGVGAQGGAGPQTSGVSLPTGDVCACCNYSRVMFSSAALVYGRSF